MLEILAFTWKDLLNPEFYITNGGLWLFLFIVFAETGLFAGFFLPGDSLLFVAGIYIIELSWYFYNVAGCVALAFSMLLACHYLYRFCLSQFNFDLKEHLEVIVLGIVLVTTLPVIYKIVFGKRNPSQKTG